MRRLFAFVFLIASVPSFAQTDTKTDEIVAKENAFWKSYVDGNTTELAKLFQPEFVNVEQRIWDRDQVLAFVKQFHAACTLAPVTIVDPRVSFLTPDIATIVYQATETPTCGARTMSGDTNISTVWIRRDGSWRMHLHTEYAVPASQK